MQPAEAPAPQPVEDVEVPAPSDAPSQPATEDEDGDEEPDEPSPGVLGCTSWIFWNYNALLNALWLWCCSFNVPFVNS